MSAPSIERGPSLDDQTLAIFANVGPWEGFEHLFRLRAEKATRERMDAQPDDAVANAKAKRAHEIYSRDLAGIRAKVDEFRVIESAKTASR
jgi:hypothetical protein